MRSILAVAAIVAVSSPASGAAPEPVQVMVVGTYHFDNPGRDLHKPQAEDVLKPERQKELDTLGSALAEFRPTKIMVERVAKTPDLIDPRYARFKPADLATNRDERVQIAYRVANRLGHETVYAIDEEPGKGEPDYFAFGNVVAWAQANGGDERLKAAMAEGAAAAAWIEKLQKVGSIGYVLREINRPERSEKEQSVYYELLKFGDTEAQPGADLNAMWYLRNAKIFAKLMTVAKTGDRVLVVYGSGHNYWLRHFASTSRGYRNVDPTGYLHKAAARR